MFPSFSFSKPTQDSSSQSSQAKAISESSNDDLQSEPLLEQNGPQSIADQVLYANKASLNIGQLYRYKITYTQPDSVASGSSLWLKVRNLEVVALRAAFLAGPFLLYVDVKPEDYDQNTKVYSSADQPVYEPQLKPAQSFYAELYMNKNKTEYTWIVDVVSQIIFSNTAQVQFELSIGTTKQSLHDMSSSDRIAQDPAIVVSRMDTLDIWHSPVPKLDSPLHLVVVTHGLHSNTGADMLYVKEAIDKTARKTGENIIVRGYFGNVRKTEKGIKYLGKRVAEYIVKELAPETPENLPPVKKISFVGHSLGGLVQTYAIAYIATHYPDFFKRVEPVNFITLASPLLGISNENPAYVKFALDIGFVGKSGQDMSLLKKPNGSHKPLLQILPTGPTHEILVMFKHRTVYANAVNDGIVPLRTSALLYLDYQGLGKVEEAKRSVKSGESDGTSARRVANPEKSDPGTHDSVGMIPNSVDTMNSPMELNNKPNKEEKKGIWGGFGKSQGELMSIFSYFTPQTGPSKPPKMYTRGQTVAPNPGDLDDSYEGTSPESPTNNKPVMTVPKKASVFESGVSALLPPLPPQPFIINPETRPSTIFHDKIYHDYDLPPPRLRQRSTLFGKKKESKDSNKGSKKPDMVDKSKLEERIAREWHKDMSWRKVLVKLEPDAHNNIVVRRRFVNAYGWPVIDHLVKNHFGGNIETPPLNAGEETGKALKVTKPIDVLRMGLNPREANKNDSAKTVGEEDITDMVSLKRNVTPLVTYNISNSTTSSESNMSTPSSGDLSSPSANMKAWSALLDPEQDESEDEGLLFTMGNVFDNIREFSNLNFNSLSLTGQVDAPTKEQEIHQNTPKRLSNSEDDVYDMYGPLNGETVEERLAKQGYVG